MTLREIDIEVPEILLNPLISNIIPLRAFTDGVASYKNVRFVRKHKYLIN
jgi:hypothetical protein